MLLAEHPLCERQRSLGHYGCFSVLALAIKLDGLAIESLDVSHPLRLRAHRSGDGQQHRQHDRSRGASRSKSGQAGGRGRQVDGPRDQRLLHPTHSPAPHPTKQCWSYGGGLWQM